MALFSISKLNALFPAGKMINDLSGEISTNHNRKPLLVILGPTASGKTQLAARVAHALNGEIVSADSRQVYRDMNIGTGKDLEEYQVNGFKIPYHLIDIMDAGEMYNVNRFQHDFKDVCNDLASRGKVPVVCGGTGYYLYAMLKGHTYSEVPVNEALRTELDELDRENLLLRFRQQLTSYTSLADTSTRKRLIRAIEIGSYLMENPGKEISFAAETPVYDAIVFGLNPPLETRRRRISERLTYRLANGLTQEVQALLDSGLSSEQLIYYGLEYKYVTQYLTGLLSFAEMKLRLEIEIHRFAKRQMTFFRKMEKDDIKIHWLDPEQTGAQHMESIREIYEAS